MPRHSLFDHNNINIYKTEHFNVKFALTVKQGVSNSLTNCLQ